MQAYQHEFIQLALEHEVLRFGQFTLKSGRVSPYFFNAGLFNTGAALAQLGRFYAQAIEQQNMTFDMLFGPAYKGIPLMAATAIALVDHYACDVPYSFNRKEAKTHGEAGSLVGAPLAGRVLLIDDVMTAGTAIRESVTIIEQAGAKPAGVVVALDRQERGKHTLSALQEVAQDYGIPVFAIVTLTEVIEHIQAHPTLVEYLDAVQAYRIEYGV